MNGDRLGAVDEGYLVMESATEPLHVGSVGVFEGPGLCDEHGDLRLDELRARIEARLGLLPRFRQRIADVPFGLARPRWVDDDAFDIAHHVDAVVLPAPHDEAALIALVEELMMERLDRRRPLWHLRMVTGLSGGRVAMVERAHHALVDGVSGVDVSLAILDTAPDAAVGPADAWEPAPAPSPAGLVVEGMRDRWSDAVGAVGSALGAVAHPRRLLGSASEVVRALDAVRRGGVVAPASSLNGPLSDRRRITVLRTRLESARAASSVHHATVNDLVLTAVSGGLRSLFLGRGEALPTDREVKVLVPVSVRSATEALALGNRVGALLVSLPIGLGDPVETLEAVATATRALKASPEASVADRLLHGLDLLPPGLARVLQRSVDRQPLVNLVVTNIPGPQVPLYAMGSRLLEAWPVVPLGAHMTLEVAVLSYDGALTITATSDPRACPDVDRFAAGVERTLQALHASWTPVVPTAP